MDFPISINWTSSFPILWLLGGIFHLYSIFKRNFCKQTVQNLIRCRILRHLVWFWTVCQDDGLIWVNPNKSKYTLIKIKFRVIWLNLFILIDYSIHIDTITMELSKVYFKELWVKISTKWCIFVLMIVFISANRNVSHIIFFSLNYEPKHLFRWWYFSLWSFLNTGFCQRKRNTVKPVKNGHPQIDKTKVLMTNGSVKWRWKVLQNAPLYLH